MRVRFWGVRGSTPWSVDRASGVGCNTACLEVVDDQTGATLVLDAGSGIFGLGAALNGTPRHVPVLITHYHWDHLIGLPLFSPLYRRGWSCSVWGPRLGSKDARCIQTLFEAPYYSVPEDQLSIPDVHTITPGRHMVDDFEVDTLPLTHPGGSVAYRIKGSKGSFVYATDHEWGVPEVDAALTKFCEGAVALVFDCQYTPEELPLHKGWGHSSTGQGAALAKEAGVEQLLYFHHDPGRSDVAIEKMVTDMRGEFAAIDAAREGLVIEF